MLIRTLLALLLLLPAAASAQDLDTAVSAVVRISGMRNGVPVRGSGFIVALDRDTATIVTASHVIEGLEVGKIEIIFASNPRPFLADVILGMESNNPNGLAVFQVSGALPQGLTALTFENERPHLGEALFLLGFPQMALSPRMTQRVLSARSGTLLLVDQEIGEGFSGGPVLKGSKVVGVVTDMDGQTTYAVNSVVAREALEGWGVRLGSQSSSPMTDTATQTKPAPQAPEKCVAGEESTEAGIVFIRICQGTFAMGSADDDPQAYYDEKPAHRVTLSEFWLGKTEITNEQYRRFRSDHQGEARLPATNISWFDAKAACEYFGGRLPTEAEWEYAARAGRQTSWSFGNDEKMLRDYAWYGEPASNPPHPVGKKRPNSWGLYDMHGNVWEWVADQYGTYPGMAQANPSGSSKAGYRVARGGASISDSTMSLRSAFRGWNRASYQSNSFGFRCAHSLHSQP